MPRSPMVSHIVRLLSGQDPHANKDLLLHLQGPRDHLLEANGKGQFSFWVRLILHYTQFFQITKADEAQLKQ